MVKLWIILAGCTMIKIQTPCTVYIPLESYYLYLCCQTPSKADKTETCKFLYEFNVNRLQRYHYYYYFLSILISYINKLVLLRFFFTMRIFVQIAL